MYGSSDSKKRRSSHNYSDTDDSRHRVGDGELRMTLGMHHESAMSLAARRTVQYVKESSGMKSPPKAVMSGHDGRSHSGYSRDHKSSGSIGYDCYNDDDYLYGPKDGGHSASNAIHSSRNSTRSGGADDMDRNRGGFATFTTVRAEYTESPLFGLSAHQKWTDGGGLSTHQKWTDGGDHLPGMFGKSGGSGSRDDRPSGTNNKRSSNEEDSSWARSRARMPTYEGAADNKAPSAFVVELESYADDMGYTEMQVLNTILPAALMGEAYRWFTAQGGFKSWEDFRRSFTHQFQPGGFPKRRRLDLEFRSQAPDESLTEFVYAIDAMYNQINPYASEAEKVQRVLQLANPKFQNYLAGRSFPTIWEIAADAPSIEQTVREVNSYRPAPPAPANKRREGPTKPSGTRWDIRSGNSTGSNKRWATPEAKLNAAPTAHKGWAPPFQAAPIAAAPIAGWGVGQALPVNANILRVANQAAKQAAAQLAARNAALAAAKAHIDSVVAAKAKHNVTHTVPPKHQVTQPSKPKQAQPKQTQPKQTQPKQTQPKQTQPKQTQPKQTQPKQSQSKQTQSKPSQSKPAHATPAAAKDRRGMPPLRREIVLRERGSILAREADVQVVPRQRNVSCSADLVPAQDAVGAPRLNAAGVQIMELVVTCSTGVDLARLMWYKPSDPPRAPVDPDVEIISPPPTKSSTSSSSSSSRQRVRSSDKAKSNEHVPATSKQIPTKSASVSQDPKPAQTESTSNPKSNGVITIDEPVFKVPAPVEPVIAQPVPEVSTPSVPDPQPMQTESTSSLPTPEPTPDASIASKSPPLQPTSEPAAIPEPMAAEPAPTPEPMAAEPAPTPEPIAVDPAPTPEPIAAESTSNQVTQSESASNVPTSKPSTAEEPASNEQPPKQTPVEPVPIVQPAPISQAEPAVESAPTVPTPAPIPQPVLAASNESAASMLQAAFSALASQFSSGPMAPVAQQMFQMQSQMLQLMLSQSGQMNVQPGVVAPPLAVATPPVQSIRRVGKSAVPCGARVARRAAPPPQPMPAVVVKMEVMSDDEAEPAVLNNPKPTPKPTVEKVQEPAVAVQQEPAVAVQPEPAEQEPAVAVQPEPAEQEPAVAVQKESAEQEPDVAVRQEPADKQAPTRSGDKESETTSDQGPKSTDDQEPTNTGEQETDNTDVLRPTAVDEQPPSPVDEQQPTDPDANADVGGGIADTVTNDQPQ